MFLEVDTSKLE